MTSDEIEDNEEDAGMPDASLLNRSLNEEMKNSYINYAMSVIIGRALPDARDGLKASSPSCVVWYARRGTYCRQKIQQIRTFCW